MKFSESSSTSRGLPFGEQKTLWVQTFGKRKFKKNYYWNVDPNVNNRDSDEVITGFFTIDSKRGRITVREDSDGDARLSGRDRVIGRGRVPRGYELDNGFGYISFKADAETRSKNGKSSASFKYYVQIDPSEADQALGLGSVYAPIKSSWMRESDLIGPRGLSVDAFEEMMGG